MYYFIFQNWRPQGCTAAATSAAIAAQSHEITAPSAAVATCAITAIEQPHPSTQEGWLERIQQAAGLVSSPQQYNTLNDDDRKIVDDIHSTYEKWDSWEPQMPIQKMMKDVVTKNNINNF